jgi:hypothetical protein
LRVLHRFFGAKSRPDALFAVLAGIGRRTNDTGQPGILRRVSGDKRTYLYGCVYKDSGKDRSGTNRRGCFMKMKKIVFVGLIGLMMAVGLVLVGCKGVCDNNTDCRYDSKGTTPYGSCSSSDCAAVKAKTNGDSTSTRCDC